MDQEQTTQAPAEQTSQPTTSTPAQSNPEPKSAVERAAKDFGTGTKPKMTWDELELIQSGATAPQQNPGAGGQPAADGRQNPTGAIQQEQSSEPASQQPVQTQAQEEPQPQAQAQPQGQQMLPVDVVRQLLSQNQQTQQQAMETQTHQAVDDIPDHSYSIPNEVMNLLRSQDPNEFSQGLSQHTRLVARTVHRAAREDLKQAVQQVYQMIPQIVGHLIGQQQQTKAIHDDFYGTYKDLGRPELKPIVLQTAMMLAQRDGHTEWNSKLRDDVAKHVYGLLGRAGQPVQANQQQSVKQPAMMGTGARPAPVQPNNADKLSAEIMDVLMR